jgi:hypothetical protein
LGLSQPLSRQRVFPSPQKQGGGGTLACGWGVGGSPNSDEWHTLWYSLYVLTLCSGVSNQARILGIDRSILLAIIWQCRSLSSFLKRSFDKRHLIPWYSNRRIESVGSSSLLISKEIIRQYCRHLGPWFLERSFVNICSWAHFASDHSTTFASPWFLLLFIDDVHHISCVALDRSLLLWEMDRHSQYKHNFLYRLFDHASVFPCRQFDLYSQKKNRKSDESIPNLTKLCGKSIKIFLLRAHTVHFNWTFYNLSKIYPKETAG